MHTDASFEADNRFDQVFNCDVCFDYYLLGLVLDYRRTGYYRRLVCTAKTVLSLYLLGGGGNLVWMLLIWTGLPTGTLPFFLTRSRP